MHPNRHLSIEYSYIYSISLHCHLSYVFVRNCTQNFYVYFWKLYTICYWFRSTYNFWINLSFICFVLLFSLLCKHKLPYFLYLKELSYFWFDDSTICESIFLKLIYFLILRHWVQAIYRLVQYPDSISFSFFDESLPIIILFLLLDSFFQIPNLMSLQLLFNCPNNKFYKYHQVFLYLTVAKSNVNKNTITKNIAIIFHFFQNTQLSTNTFDKLTWDKAIVDNSKTELVKLLLCN